MRSSIIVSWIWIVLGAITFNANAQLTSTQSQSFGIELSIPQRADEQDAPVFDERTLTFDSFSTVLGTLTGVSIGYNSTATGEASGINRICTGPYCLTPYVSVSTQERFTSSLTAPTDTALSLYAQSNNAYASFGAASNVTGNLVPASLSLFQDTGTFNIVVKQVLRVFSDGYYEESAHATWNGDVTITYTYDAAIVTAVPEPEIYAMMGVGLGLMGWIARRRKQQAA